MTDFKDIRHVRREVGMVAVLIREAKNRINPETAPEVWGILDRAQAHLDGLSPVIGPWEPDLAEDVNSAAASVVRRAIRER